MLRNKKVIKHWKSSNIVKHPILLHKSWDSFICLFEKFLNQSFIRKAHILYTQTPKLFDQIISNINNFR
jgi:hypothetical protein